MVRLGGLLRQVWARLVRLESRLDHPVGGPLDWEKMK